MAPPEVVAGISPRGALARGKAIPLRSRVSFALERQLNFAIALSDSDFAMLSHFPGANIGDTDGLFPQIVRYPTSSLRLCGERVVATSRVSVDPAARSGASDVSYPTERDDGWMEVKLAEFSNDERMLTEAAVMVDFREVNDHVKKIGLIVEGLEFRPTIH
ncbi:hypothetical protein OsI_30358 [Oryza sativa Indica Group]|uniref:Uncharacterized protein n=1 Tax=Oryza sativa subsp. indica TaxID=39946 RepID=B8BD08_ORYSI|nr:hypothetical protein OsI_30358 [Oryza sativa Indica Group]